VIYLTEEIKDDGLPGEQVIRLLEQSSKYGMDQETMLIYISSVNLMSILGLIGRRYGVKSNFSLPVPAALPVLPPLVPGTTQATSATGTAPAGGPSLENLMGMFLKMLGSQGGGNSPAGQGINPSTFLNLLNVLGQNVDLGSLINTMAGLLGSVSKAAPKPETGAAQQPAPSIGPSTPVPVVIESGVGQKAPGDDKAVKREVPKIMKWEPLEDRKKA